MRKPIKTAMKGIAKAKAKIHGISERAQAKVAAAKEAAAAKEHNAKVAPPKHKGKGKGVKADG